MKVTLSILSGAAVVAAAVVFWLFLADVVRLHGDAMSGGQAGDRFYVADHGRRTEVSETDWRDNRSLELAMIWTAPLGMLGALFLGFGVLFPRLAFRGPADERDARVREVVASGPALAATKCSASLGMFNAGGGLVRADVRPAGLVVRVKFIGTGAVRREEVTALREKTQLLQRFVEIEHSSKQVASPIRLMCSKDAAFTEALKGLAAGKG